MIHYPVMKNEMLEYLCPEDNKIYIDGTFGAGGYTRAILSSCNSIVYAVDCDPNVYPIAKDLIKEFGESRLKFIEGNFSSVANLMHEQNINYVDGIVLDLGVSSMQIDQASRGFSFQKDGPLDMRMSNIGYSAYEFVNEASEKDLADIIYNYGDEPKSRRIAKFILDARKEKPIETTIELARIIHKAVGNKYSKIDLATKTFQAIRIFVNDELGSLRKILLNAEEILADHGKFIIISFHSLEDKMVKDFFVNKSGNSPGVSRYVPDRIIDKPIFKLLTKKSIKPSKKEIDENYRSRSARLRAVEKLSWKES